MRVIEALGTTEELDDVFSDASVLGEMLRFETALARAQARIGFITQVAAEEVETAARIENVDATAIAREARESTSIAIPLVKALAARAPQAHLGATSQDVIDTAMVLVIRRAREIMARDHGRIEARLRELAERHANTVMLARSLMQPAPPITFGYKAAAWRGGVRRAWKRLEGSFDAAMQIQFGGAAGTLASYGEQGPAIAAELARELGLGLPAAPWQAYRDRMAGVVTDCGIYCAMLGKIARDIALLMQPEIGEVSERGGGSSAMPNKRNPAGSIVAMAAATRTPGLVASYLTAMVQENERAAGGWQAEWPIVSQMIQATGSAVAAMAEALGDLEVNAERMRANIAATGGAVFAEKAVMLLARKVGRTEAQRLVAEAPKEELKKIDAPEDYLGSVEAFRRGLLEED